MNKSQDKLLISLESNLYNKFLDKLANTLNIKLYSSLTNDLYTPSNDSTNNLEQGLDITLNKPFDHERL